MPARPLLLLALVASGCASTSAPDGWLPPPSEAGREAYGGWVEVETAGALVEGELIALGPDSLYVLGLDDRLDVVARGAVTEARLAYADAAVQKTVLWGLGGTLSTASHGFFLILTAPTWLIATAVSGPAESRAHKLRVSRDGWEPFRAFARFPQGLPTRVDRQRLRSRR